MAKTFYDRVYREENYFVYRRYLYRPYVRSLISVSGLKPGARLLDAGCGQGFFSSLLAAEGMSVYATDISLTGVRAAKALCQPRNAKCFVADIAKLPLNCRFDCVFIRSCSLFNVVDLSQRRSFVRHLLGLLNENGVLIFIYNSNLSRHFGGWAHHGIEELTALFEEMRYPVELYLVNKFDVFVLGKHAFNYCVTKFNRYLAEQTLRSCEVVVICRPDE